MFEGEQVYFPSFKTLFKVISRRDLVNEIRSNGVKRRKKNDREIIKQAKKYNLSAVGIYKKEVLSKSVEKVKKAAYPFKN
jgi:predicted nuclease of restriction endonuclease-like RecB superfamily